MTRHRKAHCITLAFVLLIAQRSAAASAPLVLAEQLPAHNAADLASVCTELVALGPAAVTTLCTNLTPLADHTDLRVRYALTGLVKHVTRDEALCGPAAQALTSIATPAAVGAAAAPELTARTRQSACRPRSRWGAWRRRPQ